MTFVEYQKQARSTAIYKNIGKDKRYPLLGLIGETGEVAEKIKKIMRDDNHIITEEKKQAINKELGDVLWYLANICEDNKIKHNFFECTPISKDPLTFDDLVQCIFWMIQSIDDLIKESSYENDLIDSNKIGAFVQYIMQYIITICKFFSFDIEAVAINNIEKLLDRKKRGVLMGTGDNR